MVIGLSLIVMVVGGLLYVLCTALGKYGEIGELGRLAFAVGLLAFLLK